MNVAKRQIRIQLCNLVGIVTAVLVRHSDIYDSDTRSFERRCSVTVFFVSDYPHTRFFGGNAYQDLGSLCFDSVLFE